MKTVITYSTPCALTLYFHEGCDLASADWRETYKTLASAIDNAEFILRHIYPITVTNIVIWDTNTGEVLAECFADDESEDC